MFFVVNYRRELHSRHKTFADAKRVANDTGLVILKGRGLKTAELYAEDKCLAQILGNLSVGERYSECLRVVVSKLKRGLQQWREYPRNTRRTALAWIVLIHNRNRSLYRAVMSGNFAA